jgi:hypothetical protein
MVEQVDLLCYCDVSAGNPWKECPLKLILFT